MEAAAGYDTHPLIQAAERLETQAAELHAAYMEEMSGKIPNDCEFESFTRPVDRFL